MVASVSNSQQMEMQSSQERKYGEKTIIYLTADQFSALICYYGLYNVFFYHHPIKILHMTKVQTSVNLKETLLNAKSLCPHFHYFFFNLDCKRPLASLSLFNAPVPIFLPRRAIKFKMADVLPHCGSGNRSLEFSTSGSSRFLCP